MRKTDLEAALKNAELRASQNAELHRKEKARADLLQTLLDAKFEDCEPRIEPDHGNGIYYRNQTRRTVVEGAFLQVLDWCGRNLGYAFVNEDDDPHTANVEREATGLGLLAHMHSMTPAQAVLFAAEVCEQENWHGDAHALLRLYDKLSQPYANCRQEATSVTWWAE